MGLLNRIQHGWNAFLNRDPTTTHHNVGPSYSYRPDRPRMSRGNEKSLVTSIYNRIALDVSSIPITHCKVDEEDRFVEKVKKSTLNDCLNIEANIDQTGRAFMQDVVMSMLDEGCVAIVPVDTDLDPATGSFKIHSMRTGKILDWYPKHVRVRVYNENSGNREDILLPKNMVAIVENPLFAVMNEPNSTMQRLIRKLNLLDAIDEQSGSGKLDMIIQLPYTIKSETRRAQADKRRKDMEDQLKGPFGIAYVDATEKIVQLNRPIENNLMKQIEYLTSLAYSQLNFTQAIQDGSASEQEMLNYHTRLVEPILSAIVDEMKRKFLTKTARSQMQTLKFFRDPFKLVPLGSMAELADKLTRNEVLTSNEVRQGMGMKPSKDPKADQLINSNLNHPEAAMDPSMMDPAMAEEMPMEEAPVEEQTGEEPAVSMDMPVSELPKVK